MSIAQLSYERAAKQAAEAGDMAKKEKLEEVRCIDDISALTLTH